MPIAKAFSHFGAVFFAFVLSSYSGAFEQIHYPGSLNTVASGIDGNIIVGSYWNESSARHHGFRFDGVNYKTIDFPGATSTTLKGVDGDRIVGTYTTTALGLRGFVYDGVNFTTIAPPATSTIYANGTRALGIYGDTVVGEYMDNAAQLHGYIFDGLQYRTLDFPGGSLQRTYDAHESRIVGSFYSGGTKSGYLYDGAAFSLIQHPLATAPSGTEVTTIDGDSIAGHYGGVGFVLKGGEYTDIYIGNSVRVWGISGSRVVGDYTYRANNETRYTGFMLTVPEPTCGTMVVFGLLAVIRMRRHRVK